MIDHHVDRPGVEAWQRAKLTGPNRPTGSISPHPTQHASVLFSTTDAGMATHAAQNIAKQKRTRTLPPDLIRGPSHPSRAVVTRRLGDGLDDLVAMAGGPHPIPSRTRP